MRACAGCRVAADAGTKAAVEPCAETGAKLELLSLLIHMLMSTQVLKLAVRLF